MRNVYIETFFRGGNYGTSLQALGLSRYLRSCGYHPVLVRNFRVHSVYLQHPSLISARLKNRMKKKERLEFFSPSPYAISPERQKRLDAFEAEYFDEISITDRKKWNLVLAENPIFVVGSDIVWQPARGYPSRYFLDYAVVSGAPCFSYASSIGAKELPKEYHSAYRKYLGAFRSIGVREEASVQLLEPIVSKPVTRVIDPTLLHTAEDWNFLAEKAVLPDGIGHNGFALCYFVMDDSRYWDYVAKMHEATGIDIIVLPMHYSDEAQPYTIVRDGTPCEFVWLVKHADVVITDSFHACCLSLLHKKDFYLLRRSRPDEDDKYDDFLNRYGLQNRVVLNPLHFEPKPLTDYSHAIAKLRNERIDSMAFIEGTLASL